MQESKIRNLEITLHSSVLLISCLQFNPSADFTSKYVSIPSASLHIYYPGVYHEAKWVEVEKHHGQFQASIVPDL